VAHYIIPTKVQNKTPPSGGPNIAGFSTLIWLRLEWSGWAMRLFRHPSGGDSARKRFCVVLIKPSHYDDDGYVIRWYRSPMPANSLASVYGLIDECARRQILGPDVDIDITAIDETNTRVRIDRIISDMRANNNFGFVGLVGVQSNQYPRSLHIAKPLREAGIPVILGGFHVSGMMAMFDKIGPDLQAAFDMGITLFAGEAEGRIHNVLRDAAMGTLKPIYNYINDLPALEEAVIPFLPGNSVRKTIGNVTTFDAGRGCPFQCSFCTIINVQGRKSRRRSPDDVERLLRKNYEQGIDRFFITDDNFARNKGWEAIFDRIIKLREQDGMDVRFLIQVDTLCHKIPNFVAKASPVSSSDWKTLIPTIFWPPRSGRTRSPNTATCYWPGKRSASGPMPAIFLASRMIRRNRRVATSRSSRRKCRSTCSSSFF
jgi:hypothetical protein